MSNMMSNMEIRVVDSVHETKRFEKGIADLGKLICETTGTVWTEGDLWVQAWNNRQYTDIEGYCRFIVEDSKAYDYDIKKKLWGYARDIKHAARRMQEATIDLSSLEEKRVQELAGRLKQLVEAYEGLPGEDLCKEKYRGVWVQVAEFLLHKIANEVKSPRRSKELPNLVTEDK